MEHSFIDKYSNLDSIIHRLDPRTKILSIFIYVVFVVLTSPNKFSEFFGYSVLIFILIFLSRLPFGYVLRRSFVIFPFVFLVVIFVPFYKFDNPVEIYRYGRFFIVWNVLIKSWLSVIAITVLTSTTRFSVLLKGFEKLKLPKFLIMCVSFMYRYIFVLIDEVQRLQRARDSRYFGGKFFLQLKVYANIIGLLFIKTYNRAERVYQNMVSRGFDGNIRILNNLKLTSLDFSFCIVFSLIILVIKILV